MLSRGRAAGVDRRAADVYGDDGPIAVAPVTLMPEYEVGTDEAQHVAQCGHVESSGLARDRRRRTRAWSVAADEYPQVPVAVPLEPGIGGDSLGRLARLPDPSVRIAASGNAADEVGGINPGPLTGLEAGQGRVGLASHQVANHQPCARR